MQHPFHLKIGRHTDHFNSSAQGWLALVLVTLLWGSTYPIIKETLTVISPSLVLCFRLIITLITQKNLKALFYTILILSVIRGEVILFVVNQRLRIN